LASSTVITPVVLFEAGGDRPEVFEFVEEAFDEISEAIEVWAERWKVDAPGHRLDVGQAPRSARVWRKASLS
jgi:hypothetical protein